MKNKLVFMFLGVLFLGACPTGSDSTSNGTTTNGSSSVGSTSTCGGNVSESSSCGQTTGGVGGSADQCLETIGECENSCVQTSDPQPSEEDKVKYCTCLFECFLSQNLCLTACNQACIAALCD